MLTTETVNRSEMSWYFQYGSSTMFKNCVGSCLMLWSTPGGTLRRPVSSTSCIRASSRTMSSVWRYFPFKWSGFEETLFCSLSCKFVNQTGFENALCLTYNCLGGKKSWLRALHTGTSAAWNIGFEHSSKQVLFATGIPVLHTSKQLLNTPSANITFIEVAELKKKFGKMLSSLGKSQ